MTQAASASTIVLDAPEVGLAAGSLLDLLRRYGALVETLATEFSEETLLEALLIRDAIEQSMHDGNVEDRRRVNDIVGTDTKFHDLPLRTFYGVRKSLIKWRRSLTPPADAWWWFLDRGLPAGLQRLEQVILVVSVALFPFSLGVAIELARLHGGEEIGVVSLLPITTTFLGSLSLGGILSLSFRDRWTTLLEEMGFGARWRAFATCLIFTLLTFIVALWFARPQISRYYNDSGVFELAVQRGPQTQLSSAQIKLERAVRFDPTNAVAHYNLGRVHEDLLDEDRAIAEYLIAFRAGLDLAGNNVSHLYLIRGQFDRAAIVLQRSFALTEAETTSTDRDLRYTLFKNLGWARLGQMRFHEARHLLEDAVRLKPERADAHCLLAKTLDGLHETSAASEWRMCLGLGWHDDNEPARETWIGEAKAFLEKTP